MDIREQRATYGLFMGMTKWGSLAIASLLVLLVVWFCVGAGFGPALIIAVIVAALGGWFLAKKPAH
jgi:hypothetical protein